MADKVYSRWSSLYETNRCEQFYYGHQKEPGKEEHYVVNLTFANVEIRIPSMLFYHPKATVTPKPSRTDDPGTLVEERASLLEDTGQSLVEDPRVGFFDAALLCIRESFFRFGVLYVGYETRDYIDNPFLGKPPLPDDSTVVSTLRREDAPRKLPTTDGIFVRRIPARQFRVSHNSHNALEENDWVGFYTWEYPSDIEKNPRYTNTKGWKPNTQYSLNSGVTGDASGAGVGFDQRDKDQAQKGLVKVWHIWDCREFKRYDFPDGGDKFFVDGEDWIRSVSGRPLCPFIDLFHHPILDEYYPVPVLFNWLDPQRELNDDREMKRIHRKKAARRYTARPGVFNAEQLSMLEHGEDFTIVESQGQQQDGVSPLTPVPDVPLDRNLYAQSALTERDFNMVSGTPSEDRGVATAETATQASIIESSGQIRESYYREQVGKFLAKTIKLMLEVTRSKAQFSFWVKRNVDPVSMGREMEEARVKAIWKLIKAKDLGDMNFDVSVDVEALSPVNSEATFKKWMTAFSMIRDPAIMSFLSKSPYLMKKFFSGFGVRSWRDLSEIKKAFEATIQEQQQQMMQLAQMKLAQQGQGGAGVTPSPGPGALPDAATIGQNVQAQLAGQGGAGSSGLPS